MTAFLSLIHRELRRALAGGGLWLPLMFYLSVATLYPFAVGPDRALLARTGGGVLWIAALTAALLPVERLVRPDLDAGVLDQLRLVGLAEESVAAAKLVGHWLGFGPPLLAATLVAGTLMGLESAALARLILALAIAGPGLAALGLLVAALTAGLGSAGAVAGMLMVPLAIPLLIFGAGAQGSDPSALPLLAAASLFLTAITPFAAGAAIRAARE
jgi:heme exporter protein B